MNLSLLFGLPAQGLLRNKVRTLLTMLGIVIGIAGIISMVAVGEGAKLLVERQVRSMGSNMIMVMPGAAQTGGLSLGSGSRTTLTSEDADAIRDLVPGVKAVSPVIQTRGQIIYGNLNWAPGSIRGEGEDYLEVKDWDVIDGDYFTADDVQVARKVCVIGTTVQANLFPDESPVGKRVRLKGMPFRITGVLGPKGNTAGGEDQDDVVIVPWTTAKHVLQGSRFNNVDVVLVSSEDAEGMPEVQREISALLRERHHLVEVQPEDFRTLTMVEMIERATESARIMTTLLAAVASISLLVGGVGVMNIMLVSVTERTREIGLRMAVGARQSDILLQFLSEGILLSLVAGGIGILVGAGLTAGIGRFMQWPTHVSTVGVLAAFLSSSAVGIFFGFYPSLRASRLDPIAALRSE
jgi:putative ABC transport system permease protein